MSFHKFQVSTRVLCTKRDEMLMIGRGHNSPIESLDPNYFPTQKSTCIPPKLPANCSSVRQLQQPNRLARTNNLYIVDSFFIESEVEAHEIYKRKDYKEKIRDKPIGEEKSKKIQLKAAPDKTQRRVVKKTPKLFLSTANKIASTPKNACCQWSGAFQKHYWQFSDKVREIWSLGWQLR